MMRLLMRGAVLLAVSTMALLGSRPVAADQTFECAGPWCVYGQPACTGVGALCTALCGEYTGGSCWPGGCDGGGWALYCIEPE